MTSLTAEQREKKVIENLGKLVGSEKLVGCRFKYRPVVERNRIFVKATGVAKEGEGLVVKDQETGEFFEKVPLEELSIGIRSRNGADPLIALVNEIGLDTNPYLKNPVGTPEAGGRSERFHTPEEPGLESIQRERIERSREGEFAGFRRPTYAEAREMLAGRPGYVQAGVNVEVSNLSFGGPGSAEYAPPGYEGLAEPPPGFGRAARPQMQRPFAGRQDFGRIPRQTVPLYQEPANGENPFVGDYAFGEQQQPAGNQAQPLDRLQMRIDQLEEQVRANTDKAAMESEIKRHATAIDPFRRRGLFAQHEMLAAIYAAPEAHKGPLVLSHNLGVFLKNRCIKLSYMAEDLATYAQQKIREIGEKPTKNQVAMVEKNVLRYFQEKRVKAEDVLAKHPEWLRDENR